MINNTSHKRQKGVALVIVLILMALVLMLTVTSMKSSSINLKISGNQRMKELGFEAAESGLLKALDAEAYTVIPTSTNPAVSRSMPKYYEDRSKNENLNTHADLDVRFIEQRNNFLLSGYQLNTPILVYQVDSHGVVTQKSSGDQIATGSVVRMGAILVMPSE